jgi:hypothetical protein
VIEVEEQEYLLYSEMGVAGEEKYPFSRVGRKLLQRVGDVGSE